MPPILAYPISTRTAGPVPIPPADPSLAPVRTRGALVYAQTTWTTDGGELYNVGVGY